MPWAGAGAEKRERERASSSARAPWPAPPCPACLALAARVACGDGRAATPNWPSAGIHVDEDHTWPEALSRTTRSLHVSLHPRELLPIHFPSLPSFQQRTRRQSPCSLRPEASKKKLAPASMHRPEHLLLLSDHRTVLLSFLCQLREGMPCTKSNAPPSTMKPPVAVHT